MVMMTEVLKSFGVLQSELEQAKTSLKGVDENIKRLIGRDPSDIHPRLAIKRNLSNEENNRSRQRSQVISRSRTFNHENDEPSNKRRQSVFKRLSERPSHYEEEVLQQTQKQLISKVIVTPKEVPSRQDALAAQSTDEKSKARNRRMFGALLGTLQKFQQEETKLKSKELKRAQVEKKIEEHEIREKAEIRKERQELFFNRKRKQAEIKMIELKMTRMREYAVWEERQRPRSNFILTKVKPQIYFLPRRIHEQTKSLLEKSKLDIRKMIEKRKLEVSLELQHIEDRVTKNFEQKKNKTVQHENEADVQDDEKVEDNHKEALVPESSISENGETNFVENSEVVVEDQYLSTEMVVQVKMEVDNASTDVQTESKSTNHVEDKTDQKETLEEENKLLPEHCSPKDESD